MKTTCILLLSGLLVLAACKKDTIKSTPSTTPTQIPVPNADFENWDQMIRPLSWQANGCPLCQGAPFDEYVVRQDSETVYHGKYSVQLYNNFNFQAYVKTKFATILHPTYLQAYVKDTMLSTADSVLIKVDVYYQKQHVDSGLWQGTAAIKNYTQLRIPISQNSTHADTTIITIHGQVPGRLYSSSFWVDDLSLYK
jgi:hypothetical protein